MTDLREYRNLIGGEVRPAESGSLLDSINPTTGEVWAHIPASSPADANAAVDAASAAFPAWAALAPTARAAYLERAAAVFVEYGEELARLETADNGTLLEVSRAVNGVGMSVLWNRAAHQTLSAVTGQTVTLDQNTLGLTRREPYGVVAAIIPFNMPIGMFCNKAASALAGGNTVVAKPPEQAAVGILRLGELLADIFPPGVLNIVSGEGDVGDAFVRHVDVAKVTMTGSSPTAKRIQGAAAETLTPSVFELGGKSPNIVFADADLDVAAIGVTFASVYNFNAGQACVAGSRILVERPILDEMVKRIQAMCEFIVIGDPFESATTMGPIISQEQLDRIVGYIEIGKKEAELVFGGRHGVDVAPKFPGGYWVEPTLFMTSDNGAQINRDEIFGPVAAIIPFDTDDEAIAIANDSRFGLASGVWTQDLHRVHRMIRDIESGNVWVNTYMQTRFELPFGGIKESGYGHDSVLDFTREKAAVISLGDQGLGAAIGGAVPATD